MRPRRTTHVAHRLSAALRLCATALLVAGCGSSGAGHGKHPSATTAPGHASSAPASTAPAPSLCPSGQTACVTQSPALKAAGPANLNTNLQQLVARDQRNFTHVAVSCPQARTYPVKCNFTGTDTTRGKGGPMSGTLTVLGVYTRSRTYVYQLLYGPAHAG